jgi:hypothetical protein
MLTRDESFVPSIVDDETAMLPKTTVDAVRAGGGTVAPKDKEWSPSCEEATFRRYRDFVEFLSDAAGGDDNVRIVENPAVMERYSVYLALKSGRDGGVATVVARKGTTPAARAGTTIEIDPTISKTSLAAALSTERMKTLARLILTPGPTDPVTVLEFAEGLDNLPKIPYAEYSESDAPPVRWTKPPSLDASLWRRIPHEKRGEYIKLMATGVRRGIHPDDTVSELLASA